MTTVFMVSSGSYSDYGVDGIYSTRELAEEAKKRFGSDNDIEEIEQDAMPSLNDGLYAWEVYFDDGGDVERCEYTSPNHLCWDTHWMIGRSVRVICRARDEAHAIKVASEKRAQFLATNQPQTPEMPSHPGETIIITPEDIM